MGIELLAVDRRTLPQRVAGGRSVCNHRMAALLCIEMTLWPPSWNDLK